MDKIEVKITQKYNNISIKDYLKLNHIGRSKIESIRVNKLAFLNNINVNIETILNDGDILTFLIEEDVDFLPLDKKLDIVYEDEYLLIVNKEPGIIIHPDSKEKNGTLSNIVANYYLKNNINRNIRYLHRIDRETSGLVMYAKDFLTEGIMLNKIDNKEIDRIYLAIVNGKLENKTGKINASIGTDRHVNGKMCISKTGKDALTYYEVQKEYKNKTLVKCLLYTGRTHQIRVHMSYMGNPIFGDEIYGGNKKEIKRVALHSYETIFNHPYSNEKKDIKCDLPNDMNNILN